MCKSTAIQQGCALTPLLFMLLINDCVPTLTYNHIKKLVNIVVHNVEPFVDNVEQCCSLWALTTTTNYRKEASKDNNLFLNVGKSKEIVVDFRKGHSQYLPPIIDGACRGEHEQHQVPGGALF